MNRKHLLWWVFKFLAERHPAVLREMLDMDGDFGDGATHTVAQEMNAAHARYAESLAEKER